ncbi:fimbrial protein [Pseudomonas guariconensis]|uniref:fimbrial protein n=1 Tax=Pseudomonas guariconensis TaxID=1288410 RepID=UPI002D1F163B|nr:fimbrial protein [Pseudomonas guariconensis]MEB3840453.1 type 1 fimbrial protein [Pseudomonas guariconensis]MEB3873321.1 type 1 fimbrial protein [Pseudomonas guariconensis]MEB3879688.1 type 1 fimbrial protein [Pseudomonas guariconensis]MEB3895856.1 type 1 fimbrial protein [Pseudomonas guariconensis]
MIKFITSMAVCILITAPSLSFAACAFYDRHSQQQITINIPSTLSIPRDAAVNTVIYESSPITFNGPASYECSTTFTVGIKNNSGSDSISNYFPIGNTGLSWQWIYQGSVAVGGFGSGKLQQPGGYGFNSTTHALRIVKTGNILTGATIPAGIVGYMQVESASLRPLAMTTDKSSSIILQSCETPDIAVDMGEYNLSVFTKNGNSTPPIAFNIKLNNCPNGIQKVSYSLSATSGSPAVNGSLGIIELNKNSSAKGIALQLLDSNQTPIQLDKTYVFNEYSKNGGNFSIPLGAKYVRTLPDGDAGQYDKGMSAGSANSEVTFIMNYL